MSWHILPAVSSPGVQCWCRGGCPGSCRSCVICLPHESKTHGLLVASVGLARYGYVRPVVACNETFARKHNFALFEIGCTRKRKLPLTRACCGSSFTQVPVQHTVPVTFNFPSCSKFCVEPVCRTGLRFFFCPPGHLKGARKKSSLFCEGSGSLLGSST